MSISHLFSIYFLKLFFLTNQNEIIKHNNPKSTRSA